MVGIRLYSCRQTGLSTVAARNKSGSGSVMWTDIVNCDILIHPRRSIAGMEDFRLCAL